MRKFKKQVTAILLGIAIAVTQPGWGNIGVLPPISAEAAETDYILNGDFEDGLNNWKIEGLEGLIQRMQSIRMVLIIVKQGQNLVISGIKMLVHINVYRL